MINTIHRDFSNYYYVITKSNVNYNIQGLYIFSKCKYLVHNEFY